MILSEIKMNPDPGLEGRDSFELIARNFDHGGVEFDLGSFSLGSFNQRRAEISADERFHSRGLEDFAGQHRDRALAVGAGNGNHRRRNELAREFELAYHGYRTRAGRAQERR